MPTSTQLARQKQPGRIKACYNTSCYRCLRNTGESTAVYVLTPCRQYVLGNLQMLRLVTIYVALS